MKKAKFKTSVLFFLILLAIGVGYLVSSSNIEVEAEHKNAYMLESVNKAVDVVTVRLKDVGLKQDNITTEKVENNDKEGFKIEH